ARKRSSSVPPPAPRGPPWACRCSQTVLVFRTFRFADFCHAGSWQRSGSIQPYGAPGCRNDGQTLTEHDGSRSVKNQTMMKKKELVFRRVTHLRGPNIWTYRPVIEAWVDIGELEQFPSNKIPGLYERLTIWLPTLVEHR